MRLKAAASLFILLGCVRQSMPAYQPQSCPDLDEGDLPLEKSTKKAIFLDLLKSRGATNIISSEGYVSKSVVSAVTADFLDYIYLFREEKYVGRVQVEHDDGSPPVHPFVKIVHGKNLFGLFLVAENIRVGGKRVAQIILIRKGGKVTYKNISVEPLIERHEGMYDPYVGGENVLSGLLLCARDRDGKPWALIYIITLASDGLRVEPKPVNFAYGCSCFTDWFAGMDGREAFGMKVK